MPTATESQQLIYRWQRRMQHLALFSIVWNAAEAIAGITLGALDAQVRRSLNIFIFIEHCLCYRLRWQRLLPKALLK